VPSSVLRYGPWLARVISLHKLKEASLVIDSRPAYHCARTRPAERGAGLDVPSSSCYCYYTTLTAPAEKTALDIHLLFASLGSATQQSDPPTTTSESESKANAPSTPTPIPLHQQAPFQRPRPPRHQRTFVSPRPKPLRARMVHR
jgi:hypothetical protein